MRYLLILILGMLVGALAVLFHASSDSSRWPVDSYYDGGPMPSRNPYEQPEHYDDCPYWTPDNEHEQCTCSDRDIDAFDRAIESMIDAERDQWVDEGGES